MNTKHVSRSLTAWLGGYLGLLLLAGSPASAGGDLSLADRHRLDEFARRILDRKSQVAGYPVNQETQLDGFYAWYAQHRLYRGVMNNVGNPRKTSSYSLNTHEFENEVVDYFADLYGFRPGAYWGFVTASGTDGNSHGLYFGRKSLQSKSDRPPILYVSADAHYSIKKLADVQNFELRLIQSDVMGQMRMDDFERQLDPDVLA